MAETRQLTQNNSTVGDAAVDGLWTGVLAGVVMLAYLLVAGLAMGEGFALILGRFDPGGGASPTTGALAHLAMAGVYGIAFGLIWRLISRWRRPPAWLAGLVYGVALLLLAEMVTLRVPGVNSPLVEVPLLHFALAHVVYGLALGCLMGRSREA
jgi:hypothetical protein